MVEGLVQGKQLKFFLSNIHFHTPSEHALESKQYSMEAHFVHSLDPTVNAPALGLARTKLVIGVLFNANSRINSPFIESLKLKNASMVDINVTHFLATETTNEAYFYEGSLTTPGCDEVVNWVVKRRVVAFSKEQLEEFTEEGEENYRMLMPLNGRPISTFTIGAISSATTISSTLALIIATLLLAFVVI